MRATREQVYDDLPLPNEIHNFRSLCTYVQGGVVPLRPAALPPHCAPSRRPWPGCPCLLQSSPGFLLIFLGPFFIIRSTFARIIRDFIIVVSSPSCTHEHGTSKRAVIDAKDVPLDSRAQNRFGLLNLPKKELYQFFDLCRDSVVVIEGRLRQKVLILSCSSIKVKDFIILFEQALGAF